MQYQACKQKCFRAGEILWKLVILIDISLKIQAKKALLGKIWVFLLDTLKTIFSMGNLTQKWTQLGLFSKTRTLYSIFKKRQGSPFFTAQRRHNLSTWRYRQFFFDVAMFVLWSLVTSSNFMSISLLVLELWQFSFKRDWTEIR